MWIECMCAVCQLIDLSDDWEATLMDNDGELKEEVKLLPQYRPIVERHFAHGTISSPQR
jgi:hypothetical protein